MSLSTNQISHRQYLKSPTWSGIRMTALDYYGKICAKCNEYGTDVHHLIYRGEGQEQMSDLVVLCRSCHEALHSAERGSSHTNRIHINGLFNYLTKTQKEILSLNLESPLYSVFISDTPKGEEIRNMALKMLNVKEYYGLDKKDKNEKFLTINESKKLQENKKNKEQRKLIKNQNKFKKFLAQSNPRLYGKSQ
jgi:hypothetical protein